MPRIREKAAPREAEEAQAGPVLTPLLQQYLELRAAHPGLLLLFQIGDFFEAFDDDARLLSRELGVTLTRKWFGKQEVRPLAGIPVRSVETHLARLIRRGHKIALCEQVSPPGQGLVERRVTRTITPGTVMEPGLLEYSRNNFLAALIEDETQAGLCWADISTGEFVQCELPLEQARLELDRLGVAELVLPLGASAPIQDVALSFVDPQQLSEEACLKRLQHHFGGQSLAALECSGQPLATRAVGALLHYLDDTQPESLANLTRLRRFESGGLMVVPALTLRNLEVFEGWDEKGSCSEGSLFHTLNATLTPMGGRLLRAWLKAPLCRLAPLQERQEAVAALVAQPKVRAQLRERLTGMGDLERLLGRVRRLLATPLELHSLGEGLRAASLLRPLLPQVLIEILGPLERCDELCERIRAALADPQTGGALIIRPGFHLELDALRQAFQDGRRFLAEYESRERLRTGIRSLKVGFNKVFGYYLEVTRPNLRLVPAEYIRKQTLSNAERFFTLELKEHEALIANARERIQELEAHLFRQLCLEVGRAYERVRRLAQRLAALDVYAALAEVAEIHGYVRPTLDESTDLEIEAGRHPMLERRLGEAFTPNDTRLSEEDGRIQLITAPNMAGKSVYLKQVGVLCLLAQVGSFVPARRAHVGLVDRIFTRIGLSDHTIPGRSGFMLEMQETAHLLHQATPRSLVLLDEVGRGTSTADGLAIARAVVEYLHSHPRARPRALFATHYHELTRCADYLPAVRNFRLAVQERGETVSFLHRVEPGAAEKSFGLYVARLAGIPAPVLKRAAHFLADDGDACGEVTVARAGRALARLQALDPDALSPIEALSVLYELKNDVRE